MTLGSSLLAAVPDLHHAFFNDVKMLIDVAFEKDKLTSTVELATNVRA